MIPLIKSTFYKEKAIKKDLISFLKNAKYLSFGKIGAEFEKEFGKWQGRKYCLCVNSGSSANLAIIQALLNLGRLKKRDRVGFSALTWSTNVMPIMQLGLIPVPIDVELETLNVSSKTLGDIVKKQKIHALFLTNLLGFCSDIDVIAKMCRKEKIIFLEDNCEALGSVYKGKRLGNYSLASTFSFYVGHHMSTIEGGAICTDDEELATMLSIVRAHGWDRNLALAKQKSMRKKFKINSLFYSRYTFYDLGYNLRQTDLNAFIGNMQIPYLQEIIKKRETNFFTFAKELYSSNLYYPIRFNHMDVVSNFAFPLICKNKKIREKLVKKCNNIVEIRPIVGGDMTMQPFFHKYYPKSKHLPNASLIHEQGLYFGNNPELTLKEKKQILTIFSL